MTATELLSLRVQQIDSLSPTLKHIVLEPVDGGLLPTSLPGAHVSLVLAGRDRVFRNSYSIITHFEERSRYELIVRRIQTSRGGSAFIHETLRCGDVLCSTLPNSQFPLMNVAHKHLLIGGGIGITPFFSFLSALCERGHRFELHHFVQSQEADVFEGLLRPYASHNIIIHGKRPDHMLADILMQQPLGTHVYTCGPAGLMEAVQNTAAQLGWPATRIHFERFGAAGGAPFTVKLARSGGEVQVGEHETMLEALEYAGLPIPSSCRGGACGQCTTPVLAGAPDHRDHFLSDAEKAEGRLITPCVSRSKSATITLDL